MAIAAMDAASQVSLRVPLPTWVLRTRRLRQPTTMAASRVFSSALPGIDRKAASTTRCGGPITVA
jgi:hypothetical protein